MTPPSPIPLESETHRMSGAYKYPKKGMVCPSLTQFFSERETNVSWNVFSSSLPPLLYFYMVLSGGVVAGKGLGACMCMHVFGWVGGWGGGGLIPLIKYERKKEVHKTVQLRID